RSRQEPRRVAAPSEIQYPRSSASRATVRKFNLELCHRREQSRPEQQRLWTPPALRCYGALGTLGPTRRAGFDDVSRAHRIARGAGPPRRSSWPCLFQQRRYCEWRKSNRRDRKRPEATERVPPQRQGNRGNGHEEREKVRQQRDQNNDPEQRKARLEKKINGKPKRQKKNQNTR